MLVAASAITVIISMFQISLDPIAMLREVATNFITCTCITFLDGSILAAFGRIRVTRDTKRVAVLLALLAAGGVLGGLIAWGINDLLFPYRITSAFFYLLIVAVLSIIFGLASVGYWNIAERLHETASRLAEKEVAEQKLLRLKTEAQLEALRAKVNPHFLFNTLNSIASLIPEDPTRAEEMVQRLSNLFHYSLTSGDRALVSLAEELDFVGEYLRIEKIRLGGRLDFSIDAGEFLDDALIPIMLVQPLVENAVNYGIAPAKIGGAIEIRCRKDRDRVSITIADTGKGFDPESVNEGFGIGSVRKRLELYYPGRYLFDIESGRGTTVRIEIPVTDDLQNNPR
jgi:two-component system LytT family sensor kinase